MTDAPPQEKSFQWKWVWITLGMFAVFYLLPILAAASFRFSLSDKIVGGWSFGGIIVIAAVSAMLSKGVTIWEPAIVFILFVFNAGFQYTPLKQIDRNIDSLSQQFIHKPRTNPAAFKSSVSIALLINPLLMKSE